jgi:hypothetical protein
VSGVYAWTTIHRFTLSAQVDDSNMLHHAQILLIEMRIWWTFYLDWPRIAIFPISTTQVANITGISHCTQLRLTELQLNFLPKKKTSNYINFTWAENRMSFSLNASSIVLQYCPNIVLDSFIITRKGSLNHCFLHQLSLVWEVEKDVRNYGMGR